MVDLFEFLLNFERERKKKLAGTNEVNETKGCKVKIKVFYFVDLIKFRNVCGFFTSLFFQCHF